MIHKYIYLKSFYNQKRFDIYYDNQRFWLSLYHNMAQVLFFLVSNVHFVVSGKNLTRAVNISNIIKVIMQL